MKPVGRLVGVFLFVGLVACPATATATPLTRADIHEMGVHLMGMGSEEAARDCDQLPEQEYERKYACNVWVERTAALVTIWTGATFAPADAVTAWCVAAELYYTVRDEDRRMTERMSTAEGRREYEQSYRNKYLWSELTMMEKAWIIVGVGHVVVTWEPDIP